MLILLRRNEGFVHNFFTIYTSEGRNPLHMTVVSNTDTSKYPYIGFYFNAILWDFSEVDDNSYRRSLNNTSIPMSYRSVQFISNP